MISSFEDTERQRCEHCRDCAGCCRETSPPDAAGGVRTVLLIFAFSACVLLLAGLLASSPALAMAATGDASAGLPGDSVYRVEAQLTDQDGNAFAFSDGAGEVRLTTMFYATCPYVCPLLVDQLKSIETQLGAQERAQLRVLLITLEAEKDTPAVLSQVAQQRRIDTSRWTLAQPAPSDVRRLSAVLGVQYRQLPDGEFNHSSVISLLDREGRIVARSDSLGAAPDPEFVAAIRRELAR